MSTPVVSTTTPDRWNDDNEGRDMISRTVAAGVVALLLGLAACGSDTDPAPPEADTVTDVHTVAHICINRDCHADGALPDLRVRRHQRGPRPR